MRHLKTTLAVLGAVTILVLAGNTIALAATGKAFLLGKSNAAGKQTTLSRTTSGPVLKLNANKATGVPLAVRGTGKVANLNADKLDGLDSTALRTNSYSWTRVQTEAVNSLDLIVPLPPGTYVVGYAAKLTGGGADNNDAGCMVYQEGSGFFRYLAQDRAVTRAANEPAFSGSTLLTVASGNEIHFYCDAPSDWTTTSTEPITIYATRTNVIPSSPLVG